MNALPPEGIYRAMVGLAFEAMMNLKSEFDSVWKAGGEFDSLLELVHRHEQQGLAPREAYWILHKLWLDCGYNGSDEPDEFQNNLEYILDKAWYE